MTSTTFRDAVRKRPGMYVGGVDDMGLHHLAFIALDPVVDRTVVERQGPRGLTVEYEVDWPFDADGTRALFEPVSRGAFESTSWSEEVDSDDDDRGEWPWLGIVSALSEQFVFEVGGAAGFTLTSKDGVLVETSAERDDGVVLTFVADRGVFGERELRSDVIEARLRHLAAFAPGTTRCFREDGRELEFIFPAGLRDLLVEEVRQTASIPEKPIVIREVNGNIALEAALLWVPQSQAVDIRVYANTVRNDGGVHRDGFVEGLGEFFRAHDVHSPRFWTGGMVALVNVMVPREDYRNPTKSVLTNPDVEPFVRKAVTGALESWAVDNPKTATNLIDRMRWCSLARN